MLAHLASFESSVLHFAVEFKGVNKKGLFDYGYYASNTCSHAIDIDIAISFRRLQLQSISSETGM